MCLSVKVSKGILPDMYADLYVFYLPLYNKPVQQWVEQNFKRGIKCTLAKVSIDLTETVIWNKVILNVYVPDGILEHGNDGTSVSTVPSKPFNEPCVCMCVCVCVCELWRAPLLSSCWVKWDVCPVWRGQMSVSSIPVLYLLLPADCLTYTYLKTKQCLKPADDPQSIKINTLELFQQRLLTLF